MGRSSIFSAVMIERYVRYPFMRFRSSISIKHKSIFVNHHVLFFFNELLYFHKLYNLSSIYKSASVLQRVAHTFSVGKVMGSILSPNRVIAKDVKSCTNCCYVRFATSIVWVGGLRLGHKQVQLNTLDSCNFQTKLLQLRGWLSAS